MVVAVAGIDRRPVDELRQALVSAQATMEGTIWFTSKMRLTSDGDVRALATALDLAVDRPEVVRRQALTRVAVGPGRRPAPTPARWPPSRPPGS